MRVDDTFVFSEVWILVSRPLRFELRDLLGEVAGLIPAIDKRYLRQHEQDENDEQKSFEKSLHRIF